MGGTGNRWMAGEVPRGATYDRRFAELAAQGVDVHGEAALVAAYQPGSVLDAGCGTGRVAIELARRGCRVVGVDQDSAMLDEARRKATQLTWITADLADPSQTRTFGGPFDVVVMAGNVLLFVAPGTEGSVLSNMARLVAEGGRLITGYSLSPGGFGVEAHDTLIHDAGLTLEDRWSSWDRAPFSALSSYAVSVHRRPTLPNRG
jgi:SAM-dependent methyltransferase